MHWYFISIAFDFFSVWVIFFIYKKSAQFFYIKKAILGDQEFDFLISRIRFFDIKKYFFILKKSFSKIDFLMSRFQFCDIKNSIFWYQEKKFEIKKYFYIKKNPFRKSIFWCKEIDFYDTRIRLFLSRNIFDIKKNLVNRFFVIKKYDIRNKTSPFDIKNKNVWYKKKSIFWYQEIQNK